MATERWAVGDAYEPYIGRWSRIVAALFVPWLAVPAGVRWLDVGCGTGALTDTVLALGAPDGVTGIDPSTAFVEHTRATVSDPRARFVEGDAQALPFDEGSFGAVVSALVLNFVPDPSRALAEMARTARTGGTVGAYVWDYADGMQLIRRFWDAAGELDPAAAALDEGTRFPLCRPGPLEALFRDAGLADVAVEALEVPTVFRDFDDYWQPFLGAQGPAPGYAMSLGETRRTALRERLRATLPTAPDGSIALVARAFAARGRRP